MHVPHYQYMYMYISLRCTSYQKYYVHVQCIPQSNTNCSRESSNTLNGISAGNIYICFMHMALLFALYNNVDMSEPALVWLPYGWVVMVIEDKLTY